MAKRKKAVASFVAHMMAKKASEEAVKSEQKPKKEPAPPAGPVTRAQTEPSDVRAMVKIELVEARRLIVGEVHEELRKQTTSIKHTLTRHVSQLAKAINEVKTTRSVKRKKHEPLENKDITESSEGSASEEEHEARDSPPMTHRQYRHHKEKVARTSSPSMRDESSPSSASPSPARDREVAPRHKTSRHNVLEHSTLTQADRHSPDRHKHRSGAASEKRVHAHHAASYKA